MTDVLLAALAASGRLHSLGASPQRPTTTSGRHLVLLDDDYSSDGSQAGDCDGDFHSLSIKTEFPDEKSFGTPLRKDSPEAPLLDRTSKPSQGQLTPQRAKAPKTFHVPPRPESPRWIAGVTMYDVVGTVTREQVSRLPERPRQQLHQPGQEPSGLFVRMKLPRCLFPYRLREPLRFRSCLEPPDEHNPVSSHARATEAIHDGDVFLRIDPTCDVPSSSTSASAAQSSSAATCPPKTPTRLQEYLPRHTPGVFPGGSPLPSPGAGLQLEEIVTAACAMDLEGAPVGGDSWLTSPLIDFIALHFARHYTDVHFLPTTFAAFELPAACRKRQSTVEFTPIDMLGQQVHLSEPPPVDPPAVKPTTPKKSSNASKLPAPIPVPLEDASPALSLHRPAFESWFSQRELEMPDPWDATVQRAVYERASARRAPVRRGTGTPASADSGRQRGGRGNGLKRPAASGSHPATLSSSSSSTPPAAPPSRGKVLLAGNASSTPTPTPSSTSSPTPSPSPTQATAKLPELPPPNSCGVGRRSGSPVWATPSTSPPLPTVTMRQLCTSIRPRNPKSLLFFWNVGNMHWNFIRVVFGRAPCIELYEPMGKLTSRSQDRQVSLRAIPRTLLTWLDTVHPIPGGWRESACSAITRRHQQTGFDCGVACLLYAEKAAQCQEKEDIEMATDQADITAYRRLVQEFFSAVARSDGCNSEEVERVEPPSKRARRNALE